MKNISSIGSSKIRLTPTELNKIRGGSSGCGCCLCAPGQAAAGNHTASCSAGACDNTDVSAEV